jgi:hypothetical protein
MEICQTRSRLKIRELLGVAVVTSCYLINPTNNTLCQGTCLATLFQVCDLHVRYSPIFPDSSKVFTMLMSTQQGGKTSHNHVPSPGEQVSYSGTVYLYQSSNGSYSRTTKEADNVEARNYVTVVCFSFQESSSFSHSRAVSANSQSASSPMGLSAIAWITGLSSSHSSPTGTQSRTKSTTF